MLERIFKLQVHKTDLKTEILGGMTTFMTMVYIVFVNPLILSNAGMDAQAVFITTCLIAGIGSICMGLFTNLPVALAPAMGLNVFFAFVVVQKLGISWQVGMGTVFWGAVLLFVLTICQIRYWLIAHIPSCLRMGITAGIGLFITLIGLKNSNIIVGSVDTLVELGQITSPQVLLGMLSFLIIIVLAARNIHSAVLVSILVVTLFAWLLGDVKYQGVFSMPHGITKVVGQVDIWSALDPNLFGIIFSFMLVNLFDSSGTLLGVTEKAGLADQQGHFPNMKKALLVDSTSSMAGGLLGTSAITAYIESNAGVAVGSKTGLTTVVTGILFLLVIFLSPLAQMVPGYATAGALIYVGVLMTSILIKVDWADITEAAPAFITAIFMPFTYSITNGIALGFISYCFIKLLTKKASEINWSVWIISVLFIIKLYFEL